MTQYKVELTDKLISEHGIKPNEYKEILNIMGREPNLVELGVFSAMWSEHCSYKSTRHYLKDLYTKGDQVICGPGENAGIVDGGDNDAIIFKMESHNHPSYIEPFQGAATGVGGILRDIFTMGARPVALLNALRFGDKDKKTKHLVNGVVSGISHYGNCVGVPMLGGETTFDDAYNGNILVNAMAVGIAPKDKIFYSAASKVGGKIVYLGSKTGRDGIHGASMSSSEFDEESEAKRPTVQVGDPFEEKLLIEACLELMSSDCVLAIQDMGAAGLTCSSAEMADKGETGITLNLDDVPTREEGMNAYEIMLSESQERMLMVIKDDKEELARSIFEKWQLDFAVIGEITDTKRMILKEKGEIVADLPVGEISSKSPLYKREHEITIREKDVEIKEAGDTKEILKKLIKSKNLCSKEKIYEQYDRGVQGNTVQSCLSDAGLTRFGEEFEVTIKEDELDKNFFMSQVKLNKINNVCGANVNIPAKTGDITYTTQKGLAVTSYCNPYFIYANPVEGAKQAAMKTYMDISATGAKPLAITNCLNFASPEYPDTMGDIVGTVQGLAVICEEYNYPVVSGNVSLYNETSDGKDNSRRPILPTPTIGAVGVIDDAQNAVDSFFNQEGDFIFEIGINNGHLQNSYYSREVLGIKGGKMPLVNTIQGKRNSDFVRNMVNAGVISAAKTIGKGGLLTALYKMTRKHNLGAIIELEGKTSLTKNAYLFGEDNARFLVSVPKECSIKFIEDAMDSNVIITNLGHVGGNAIEIDNLTLDLKELNEEFEIGLGDIL